MSDIFDAMYEWSRMLTDDHIDEDHYEIQIDYGRHSHTVTNRVVRLRGKYGEIPIVISYEQYFDMSPVTSLNTKYESDILDVFVVDNSVRFEGYIKKLNSFGQFLRFFGKGKGLMPFKHQLFESYLVSPEEDNVDASEFDNRLFCDEILKLFDQAPLLRLVFQSQTGMSANFKISIKRQTVEFIDDTVNRCINLLSTRNRLY